MRRNCTSTRHHVSHGHSNAGTLAFRVLTQKAAHRAPGCWRAAAAARCGRCCPPARQGCRRPRPHLPPPAAGTPCITRRATVSCSSLSSCQSAVLHIVSLQLAARHTNAFAFRQTPLCNHSHIASSLCAPVEEGGAAAADDGPPRPRLLLAQHRLVGADAPVPRLVRRLWRARHRVEPLQRALPLQGVALRRRAGAAAGQAPVGNLQNQIAAPGCSTAAAAHLANKW